MDSESRAAMLADTAKRMDEWAASDPEGYANRNKWIGELFNGSLIVQLAKLASQGIDMVKQTWADNRLKALGIDPKIVLANQNELAGMSMQKALDSIGQNTTPSFTERTPGEISGISMERALSMLGQNTTPTTTLGTPNEIAGSDMQNALNSLVQNPNEIAGYDMQRALDSLAPKTPEAAPSVDYSSRLYNDLSNMPDSSFPAGVAYTDKSFTRDAFGRLISPDGPYARGATTSANTALTQQNSLAGSDMQRALDSVLSSAPVATSTVQQENNLGSSYNLGPFTNSDLSGSPYNLSPFNAANTAAETAATTARLNALRDAIEQSDVEKDREAQAEKDAAQAEKNAAIQAALESAPSISLGTSEVPTGTDLVGTSSSPLGTGTSILPNGPDLTGGVPDAEEDQNKELDKIIQSFLSDTPAVVPGTGTLLAGTDYTGGIPSTTIGDYSFGTEPSGPDTSGFNLGSLDANGMLKTFPGATDQTDLPSLLNPTQFPDLGMITTQNVVYGPDGTAYNTPAYAMAAGVYNYTNTPPTSGQGLASLSASYGGLGSVWRGADGLPVVGGDGKAILTSQGAAEKAFNESPAGLTAANVAETKSLLNRYPALTTTETPTVDTTPVADTSFSDALMAAMLSQPTVEAASPIQSWTASLNNGITSDAGSGTFSAPSDSGNYSGSFGNVQAPGEAGRGSAPAPAPSAPSDGGNYSNEGRNSPAPSAPSAPTNNATDGGWGSRDAGGGGGGGGGGGRVICTHFYRKGEMSRDMWRSDLEFTFKNLSPTTVRGYQYWAIPYVKLMRKSKLAENIMRPLAMHRAQELSYQMGRSPKGSLFGKVVRLIGEPICFTVGLFVGEQNWQSLWTPAKD
jgi:hypothetical protein